MFFFKYQDSQGFSLVELMIAVSILAIFFLAAISAFFGIGRGIFVSKTRTIATTLAQEKIESLKDISYPRLLVTTDSDLTTYGYDNTYYPPETISVSDISFTRRVVIHKVREKSDGKLEEVSPTSTDTGLKKIKVTVIWTDRGEEKSLSLSNLQGNPDRKATDSTFSGTVYKSGGGTIDGAKVYIEENLNWETFSDTDGTYSLRVSSGTWHLKASKPGYWEQTSAARNIGKSETKTLDFTLTEKAKGNAYGFAYLCDHLVISEVCARWSETDSREYIELYNPTTWTWTLNSSTLKLKRIKSNGDLKEIVPSYLNNTLAPSKYFLFLGSTDGSTTTASGVLADATYYAEIEANDQGIAIQDGYGLGIDTASWSGSLETGFCQERYSYPSGIIPGYGNAYDTDRNVDFSTAELNPENSSTSESPISGTPARGAVVTANDGLSSQAIASTTGFWCLTNIATGTWKIAISTGSYYSEISSVTILANVNTGVPNGSTSPSWQRVNWSALVLSSLTTDGFISGKVNSGASIIGTIWVNAGTSYSTVDNATGIYWLSVSSGSYEVTINPTSPTERYNSYYTTYTTATIQVSPGQITRIPEVTLSAAGVVRGKVTSNGTDPLPNIIIAAYDRNDYQVTTEISDSLGEYSFSQLPTSGNTYRIKPELEAGETSSPESISVDVQQGQTQTISPFTILSAYGKIAGTVKENNELIKTGVLIMATTTTISSEPPTINHTLRKSGLYYYATISKSDGSYELSLRGSAATYNVYAWYTKLSGATPITTRKNGTANVSAGQTATLNFAWP